MNSVARLLSNVPYRTQVAETVRYYVLVVQAWGLCFFNAGHYMVHRIGLAPAPNFRNYPRHWAPWLSSFLGWRRRFRIVNAELCPQAHPAVFASNHIKLDDPLFLWGAVHYATHGHVHLHFMMRDDFFAGPPWKYMPFDMNELTACAGAVHISRDRIQLSQLKPLLNILHTPGSFVMFPGRSRSRSGCVMEYREGIEDPGGVSFFLVHAQRRQQALRVAAAPLARTYNPVNRTTAVVFGEPRYLDPGASREEQRAFDLDLAVRIADLIELHVGHITAALFYLRCLHGGTPAVPLAKVEKAVERVLHEVREAHHVDPAAGRVQSELRRVLRYLARHGMLSIAGPEVRLAPENILAAPPVDTGYRRQNPVRFLTNQILHWPDVVQCLEEAERLL